MPPKYIYEIITYCDLHIERIAFLLSTAFQWFAYNGFLLNWVRTHEDKSQVSHFIYSFLSFIFYCWRRVGCGGGEDNQGFSL